MSAKEKVIEKKRIKSCTFRALKVQYILYVVFHQSLKIINWSGYLNKVNFSFFTNKLGIT